MRRSRAASLITDRQTDRERESRRLKTGGRCGCYRVVRGVRESGSAGVLEGQARERTRATGTAANATRTPRHAWRVSVCATEQVLNRSSHRLAG